MVRQSGQPFALVVQDKGGQTVVERRPVQLGALGEMAYVVEAGLNEGDRVAVTSLQALRDGAPVKVKDATPPRTEAAVGTGAAGLAGGSR